jgi:DNA-binding NtrC family response regulator
LTTTSTVPAHVLPDNLQQASGMRISRDSSGMLAPDASLFEGVADFERRKIIEALERVNYSQTEAVELLRIPLSTLNQKIKRRSIDVKRKGAS